MALSDLASRLDEYERVNSALRTAVETGDVLALPGLSARSAAYAESVLAISQRLRAGDDVTPLPPVIAPLG